MKKRLLAFVTALTLIFSVCTGITVSAEKVITVTVDGKVVNFDVQPRLIGGRTMVPLRAIFEALGAAVEWDEKSKTVTAYNEAYIVKCTIDSNTMYINNEAKTIDVAPMIIDSRTLVPARFVAEAFNCNVNWDDNNFLVTITSNPIDYSKVEQNTINTGSSTTTEPKTVYEPTIEYYPGTNVPDYTFVTGIERKDIKYYSDTGNVFNTYSYTEYGEYPEIIDYMGFLEENGWREFNKVEDDTSISWFFVNGGELVGISYGANVNSVGIMVNVH